MQEGVKYELGKTCLGVKQIPHDWICIRKWYVFKCSIPNKSRCNRIPVSLLHAQHKQRSPNKQLKKRKNNKQ